MVNPFDPFPRMEMIGYLPTISSFAASFPMFAEGDHDASSSEAERPLSGHPLVSNIDKYW